MIKTEYIDSSNYEVLSFSLRLLTSIYKTNKNINGIYINYLYRIGQEEYLLLCKHKDDKKDTKMVFMHSDRKLFKDDFNLIIKYYLELSDIEFDNSIGTMRINSQDLVDYKMILNYIVYNREEELVQDSFKVKVRKLREEGR